MKSRTTFVQNNFRPEHGIDAAVKGVHMISELVSESKGVFETAPSLNSDARRQRRRRMEPELLHQLARHKADRIDTALLLYPPFPRFTPAWDKWLVNPRWAPEGRVMNPFSALHTQAIFSRLLEPELSAAQNVWQRTFIDDRWNTTTADWNLPIRSIRHHVQRAQGHLHGVFTVEFAVHLNWQQGGACLVTPHAQGIFWGEETERERRNAAVMFNGSANGAYGIVSKREYYRPGMIGYAFKDPIIGYRTYQRSDGSFVHQAGDLSYRQISKMYRALREVYWPDIVFAVGDGRKVRRAYIEEWRSIYRRRYAK